MLMVPSQLQSCSQPGAAYLLHLGFKGGLKEFLWSGSGHLKQYKECGVGEEEDYPLLRHTEEELQFLKWRKKEPGGKMFCSELFFS